MQQMDAIRRFEAARSELYPWLDGATTRVPRLFAMSAENMPENTPSHNLNTPTPDEWREEVRARRAAKQAGGQRQAAQ